jgi:hypothetical protein
MRAIVWSPRFRAQRLCRGEIRYDLVVVTSAVPSVRAVITLLPDLEHSRWPNRARYMPHVVVGDPGQRKARISGNTLTEHYLGVLVADAPDEIPSRRNRRNYAPADVLAR